LVEVPIRIALGNTFVHFAVAGAVLGDGLGVGLLGFFGLLRLVGLTE
jgi:hypothetical protein